LRQPRVDEDVPIVRGDENSGEPCDTDVIGVAENAIGFDGPVPGIAPFALDG